MCFGSNCLTDNYPCYDPFVQGTIKPPRHKISMQKGVVVLGRSLVFPYPTVQYIPISMTWAQKMESCTSPPRILVSRDSNSIQNLWERFNPEPLELPERADNEAYILVLGMKIQDIRYRGFYATVLGSKASEGLLGKIPTQYFYKDPVVFQVKEEKGGLMADCQFAHGSIRYQ